ncbi:hypothetical protein PIB30_026311 [Stylosanthes scabra]|uniref:Putative plant transposon protein domain-containing protein n=1 Tax=Stylosanthes scabra TaxID=79078 RepID=A0ABU6W9X2_9FABA|nr:hypothetical protein [Stylosanthes scabra]
MTPQLMSYVGHSFINPNLTEAARYMCQPHVKRGCIHTRRRLRARSPRLLKNKGKAVAQSSSEVPRFKTPYHEWEEFTNPIQAVGHNMVKEFYANAWEPEKEKKKPYTYKTMVRGKEISFAPKDIKRVLKLRKDPLPNAASYEERVANKDYRLDHVQEDLCIREVVPDSEEEEGSEELHSSASEEW